MTLDFSNRCLSEGCLVVIVPAFATFILSIIALFLFLALLVKYFLEKDHSKRLSTLPTYILLHLLFAALAGVIYLAEIYKDNFEAPYHYAKRDSEISEKIKNNPLPNLQNLQNTEIN